MAPSQEGDSTLGQSRLAPAETTQNQGSSVNSLGGPRSRNSELVHTALHNLEINKMFVPFMFGFGMT